MSGARRLLGVGLAGALTTLALAGCGSSSGSAKGGGAIVFGSSESVTTTDPAGAYDEGSWELFYATYQSLLALRPSMPDPQPEAAQKCGFTSAKDTTYRCTLKHGLTFSNGDSLTSQDVKFSFDRVLKINDPNGPAPLLDTLKSVATPDAYTVVFHLKTPDATFPYKIASAAGSIVDHKVYPATSLLKGNKVVGSGVYKVSHYGKSQIDLTLNSHYKGYAKPANKAITIKEYAGPTQLQAAVKSGAVDVVKEGLPPAYVTKLQGEPNNKKLKTTIGDGTSIRVLAFDVQHPAVKQTAVRQAVAQLVDRTDLVQNVYSHTVEALYSTIPTGIVDHSTPFLDKYGDPSTSKAKHILKAAGISTPVKFTLAYGEQGANAAGEAKALRQQLDAGGLFKVTVKSEPIQKFYKDMAAGKFDAFTIGWSPDFPDPDDFVSPLIGKDNAFNSHFSSPELQNKLIAQTRTQPNRVAAADTFRQIQQITADQVPVIPLWQQKDIVVSKTDIQGVDQTLDASEIFRFWMLSRGTSLS